MAPVTRERRCISLASTFVVLGVLQVASAQAQLRPAHSGNFAAADSAATVYSNPAGMSRLDRPELVLDTIVAFSKSQFKVSPTTTTTGGDGETNNNFIAVPSLYYAAPAFHDRIRVGLSLNVPSGFGSDYGNDWAGRYVATESTLVYFAVNGAASVQATDWLSLGAGLQILYTESTSKAKINNFAEGLPDGQVEFEASGVGFGGVVSALVEIDELVDFEELLGRPMPMRMGLTYRPKTETDIDGVPELSGVGPILGAALIANGLVAKKIELKTTSPQTVGFGLYIEPIERLSVAFDFLWIDMEQFGSVEITIDNTTTNVQADYRDTYATSISFGWALNPDVDLLVGFGYLSSPIPDSKRSLSLPIDRIYIVGVGAKYRPRDWFELFAGLNYYDTGDSRVDTEPTPRSGRIVGESSPHYAVAIDLGLTFRF